MDLATAPNPLSFTHGTALPEDGIRVLGPGEASGAAMREAWRDLAARATEPNSFFEPWFLLPSIEAFGPDTGLIVLTYWRRSALVGLLPLVTARDYYGYTLPHKATWLHENAFCGAPLIAKGHEAGFWRAVLARLDQAPGAALFAHFPALPADGPCCRALTQVCKDDGRANVAVQSSSRALLASDLNAADYCAAALSRKHRKELARQMRRLGELGNVTIERRADATALGAWAQDYLALEAAGWKGEAGTALAERKAGARFFAQVIEGAGRAGRLERLTLRLDHRPIAMLATFLAPPGAFSFKTAYDERLARYSPGLQLQLEYLDTLERGEARWTDSCAAEGHPMIARLWTGRRTLVSCNVAIGGRLRRGLARPLMAYETRKRSAP
jgi:CelD/BcsL family acetyltransferase involved in cellulose biosynthesis